MKSSRSLDDFRDFVLIIRDEAYWKQKTKESKWNVSTSTADISALRSAIKDIKFTSLEEEAEFKKLLDNLSKVQFESGHALWHANEFITLAKLAAKNITELGKSVEFNSLRKNYATFRQDNEMLLRATASYTPTAKRPTSPKDKNLGKHYETENQNISALYYYFKSQSVYKNEFKALATKMQSKIVESKEYKRPAVLNDLINIIKDHAYWDSKKELSSSPTSPKSPKSPKYFDRPLQNEKRDVLKGQKFMDEAIKRYEELSEYYKGDIKMQQALDLALLKNLQSIADKNPSTEPTVQILHAALHDVIDNFKDLAQFGAWKDLKATYDLAKTPRHDF